MHWCPDETAQLLAVMGMGPAMVLWLRGRWALVRAWWKVRRERAIPMTPTDKALTFATICFGLAVAGGVWLFNAMLSAR